jgi:hypothetical protein
MALLPLLPEPYTPVLAGVTIYQQTHLSRRKPADGLVLPVPRSGTIKALLAGTVPRPRDRWISAFARVWDL